MSTDLNQYIEDVENLEQQRQQLSDQIIEILKNGLMNQVIPVDHNWYWHGNNDSIGKTLQQYFKLKYDCAIEFNFCQEEIGFRKLFHSDPPFDNGDNGLGLVGKIELQIPECYDRDYREMKEIKQEIVEVLSSALNQPLTWEDFECSKNDGWVNYDLYVKDTFSIYPAQD